MKIAINTNVDQDRGLETMQAHYPDDVARNLPLPDFAALLVQDFLNNLTPRIEGRRRELVKQAIDTITDAKLAEFEASLKP